MFLLQFDYWFLLLLILFFLWRLKSTLKHGNNVPKELNDRKHTQKCRVNQKQRNHKPLVPFWPDWLFIGNQEKKTVDEKEDFIQDEHYIVKPWLHGSESDDEDDGRDLKQEEREHSAPVIGVLKGCTENCIYESLEREVKQVRVSQNPPFF